MAHVTVYGVESCYLGQFRALGAVHVLDRLTLEDVRAALQHGTVLLYFDQEWLDGSVLARVPQLRRCAYDAPHRLVIRLFANAVDCSAARVASPHFDMVVGNFYSEMRCVERRNPWIRYSSKMHYARCCGTAPDLICALPVRVLTYAERRVVRLWVRGGKHVEAYRALLRRQRAYRLAVFACVYMYWVLIYCLWTCVL